MAKQVSLAQFQNVISVLANSTDWGVLDGDVLQKIIDNPKGAGAQFTEFLRSNERMPREHSKPNILNIDRGVPFNSFIGQGWSIAEEDERSSALAEINLSQVRLEHMLNSGEEWITGERRLRRLKEAGYLRLDAKVLQTLWDNRRLIPEHWKEKMVGHEHYIISFDGTILRSASGDRYVLVLRWDTGRWLWYYEWLDNDRSGDSASAVLANP